MALENESYIFLLLDSILSPLATACARAAGGAAHSNGVFLLNYLNYTLYAFYDFIVRIFIVLSIRFYCTEAIFYFWLQKCR